MSLITPLFSQCLLNLMCIQWSFHMPSATEKTDCYPHVLPENTHSGSHEKQMAVTHNKHMSSSCAQMRYWQIHAWGNMKPAVLHQTSDSAWV